MKDRHKVATKVAQPRRRSVQVAVRISTEEERLLWAGQVKERLKNRSDAVRFYMLRGLAEEGIVELSEANKVLEQAKKDRVVSTLPVLGVTAAQGKKAELRP